MQLIPLELVKSNHDSVRKAREGYLIERGQTLEPLGLIEEIDETFPLLIFTIVLCYTFFLFSIVPLFSVKVFTLTLSLQFMLL